MVNMLSHIFPSPLYLASGSIQTVFTFYVCCYNKHHKFNSNHHHNTVPLVAVSATRILLLQSKRFSHMLFKFERGCKKEKEVYAFGDRDG